MFHLPQCEALILHTNNNNATKPNSGEKKTYNISQPMKRVRPSEFIKFELNGFWNGNKGKKEKQNKNNKNSS